MTHRILKVLFSACLHSTTCTVLCLLLVCNIVVGTMYYLYYVVVVRNTVANNVATMTFLHSSERAEMAPSRRGLRKKAP